jgi:hypothetical protein
MLLVAIEARNDISNNGILMMKDKEIGSREVGKDMKNAVGVS